jgi:NifB/MoaA-like Fe-S oxidoreductase
MIKCEKCVVRKMIEQALNEFFREINEISKMEFNDRFKIELISTQGNKYTQNVLFEMIDNKCAIIEFDCQDFNKHCDFFEQKIWGSFKAFIVRCLEINNVNTYSLF